MSDLPALDQPQAYVVVGPDDQRGPYTLELLIGEVVAGRLHDATPVWWPGLADWTTMTAHPGLAAEIQRRRSPAPGQPPSAFAPPVAPPPPQAQPDHGAATSQHQQIEGYGYGQSAGGYPAASAPGQDYSSDMYSGYGAAATPAVEATPQEEPAAAVSPVAEPVQPPGEPAEPQEATQMHGDTVAAEVTGGDAPEVQPAPPPPSGSTFGVGAPVSQEAASSEPATETVYSDTGVAMEVEPIEPDAQDFVAVDRPDEEAVEGFRAAGDAMGLDPRDGERFSDLIARSRARSEAASIVAAVDGAFVAALSAAAAGLGLAEGERQVTSDNHRLSFTGSDGDTWEVDLGHITGTEVGLRQGDVALGVKCDSTTYQGGASSTTGEHGEVVVTAQQWGGTTSARLDLLLPVSHYVDENHDVDSASLEADLRSALATVRHTLS